MADHRDTLLLPFEKGLLLPPKGKADWALLNANVLPEKEISWAPLLKCEQGFRGDFLQLQHAGYKVDPALPGLKNHDVILVLASRSRKVNEHNLTRAWNGLKQGGVAIFAGAKTSGVQALRKWAGKHTEIAGSLSKHHGVVFWLVRKGGDWAVEPLQELHEGYKTSPGMFSASGPDKGSRLLVEAFSDLKISGRVADFGAGWGYLSAELLKGQDRIEKLELFEADWASLETAKQNVGEGAEYHWRDLTLEAPRGPYNWIIMNPPFHTGRAAEPSLGKAFIEVAAKALPSGGRLLMVANTNLPYERTLNSLFKKVERKAQAFGFKVIEAVR